MKILRRILLLVALALIGVSALVYSPSEALADNDQITVFSLATRTTSGGSGNATYGHYNYTHRGIKLHIDVDAVVGTGTVDCKVQGRDPVSGNWIDIAGASTGADGVGTTELTIYPGIGETGNVSVSDVLPKNWRVYATVATSATFSVGASYID